MQEGQPEITPLEYDEEYRPRLAARELLRRRRARHSLVEYARSVEIPGVPVTDDENEVLRPVETSMAIHHRKMLEAMERTIEKPMGRLMVFAPPGSAKSSYASVVAPAWCVSKWEQYRAGGRVRTEIGKAFGELERVEAEADEDAEADGEGDVKFSYSGSRHGSPIYALCSCRRIAFLNATR
jgi:hypothetical protein